MISDDGNIGINDTAPSYRLNVAGDNSASNGTGMLKGIIGVQNDTTAYGSSPTAGISFQTKYRSSPDVPLDVAAIYGGKENTSDADKDGYLGFATREEGGSGTMERMRITSSGHITSTSHCAFEVKLASSQGYTSGVRFKINWTRIENQQGTSFDTTNNRFTAPVTGYYHFSVCVYSYYSTFMELDGRCNGATTGVKNYRPTTRNDDGHNGNPGATGVASILGPLGAIADTADAVKGVKEGNKDMNRTRGDSIQRDICL